MLRGESEEPDERLRGSQPGDRRDASRSTPRSATPSSRRRSAAPTRRTATWSRSTTVAERAALSRRVGELHVEQPPAARRDHRPRDGQADRAGARRGRLLRRDLRASTPTTPTLLADEQIELLDGDGSALIRRSSIGVLLGIMPWNYPYYQVARFAGPNLVIGNTVLLKHAPQCPESAAAIEQLYHEAGVPAGAYINIYATQRADRRRDRRPARAGRLAHGLRARRRGRRRDRRPQPEEGRARARRLGPVHPAQHRRPRRRRRGGRRRAPRERRPGLQRGQALHRRRRALRAVPGEVHRGDHGGRAGRPHLAGHRPSARCRRRPRPTGWRTRSSAPSTRARRSSPAASARATTSRRPC